MTSNSAKLPPLKKKDQLTPNVHGGKPQEDLIKDFLNRYGNLQREQEELKTQLKDLEEEFETEGLDVKTLKTAMKVVNIIAKVKHKGTYDQMMLQLEKDLVKSV